MAWDIGGCWCYLFTCGKLSDEHVWEENQTYFNKCKIEIKYHSRNGNKPLHRSINFKR